MDKYTLSSKDKKRRDTERRALSHFYLSLSLTMFCVYCVLLKKKKQQTNITYITSITKTIEIQIDDQLHIEGVIKMV